MLKLMRENLKSLSWVLALVVAAFIFAVFADYGGQGRWLGGGAASTWAAEVEGETISVNEFLNAARNLDGYYRSLLGESYNRQNLNLQVGQQAINQLVQERLILRHARDLGLTVTAPEITREIVQDPDLQGEAGFIGADRYKTLLRRSGIDPVAYEQEIADRLLRQKWAELVTADVTVSDGQVAREIRRREETADLIFARFRTADYLDEVTVTDDEVAEYYAANEERYRRGEGRSFDLVVFDRLRAQSGVEVSEEEARAEYEAALQSRFRQPEQRRASHILIKTPSGASEAEYAAARQRAQAALDRVRAGEDFAAVAEEVSEDSAAANGGDLGFFPEGVMAIPFEQAVWALESEGDISDVVQTQFGYHVIQLTGTQEERLRSFEEVREELEREISFRRAGDLVREEAESFAAVASANPAGFADEAARQSIVMTDSGVLHAGDPIPGIGASPEVQRALFDLQEGDVSQAIPVARGYLVARFRESHPGGAPPLDEIRDTVTGDLKQERAAEAARQAAADAAAAGDLTAAAESRGFETEEATGVRRGQPVGTLGSAPELSRAAFEAPLETVQGPLEVGESQVVFTVTDRVEVGDEEIAEKTPETRTQLLAGRRQQLLSAIVRELSEDADVVYNSELIRQIDAPAAAPVPVGS